MADGGREVSTIFERFQAVTARRTERTKLQLQRLKMEMAVADPRFLHKQPAAQRSSQVWRAAWSSTKERNAVPASSASSFGHTVGYRHECDAI